MSRARRPSRDVLERHVAVPTPEVAVQVLGRRSRSRPGGRASHRRRSRPRRRRSDSDRCRRRVRLPSVTSTKWPWPSLRKQDARRSVPRVVVRRRRAGLVLAGAEEIGVDAQIQVDEAVAVVVGHRDRVSTPCERPGELEGVRRTREVPLAVVDESSGVVAVASTRSSSPSLSTSAKSDCAVSSSTPRPARR